MKSHNTNSTSHKAVFGGGVKVAFFVAVEEQQEVSLISVFGPFILSALLTLKYILLTLFY